MRALGIIGAIVLILSGLWAYFFPVYQHRYKMTVEIEGDGQVHRGTGIVDVRFYWNGPLTQLMQGNLYGVKLDGRAPLVDLGKRGVILALISPVPVPTYNPVPQNGDDIALLGFYGRTWWLDARGREARPAVLKSIRYETGHRTLDPSFYPAFVWLSDANLRESAVPVPPHEMSNLIDPSVRLLSVTVEITRDGLDEEIFSRLPWLADAYRNEQEHGVVNDPKNYQLTASQITGINR